MSQSLSHLGHVPRMNCGDRLSPLFLPGSCRLRPLWHRLAGMKTPWRWNRDGAFALALAAAFVAGLWLRLHLIMDQVFIDDEWHGFYYAIGKSPGWLLTHF